MAVYRDTPETNLINPPNLINLTPPDRTWPNLYNSGMVRPVLVAVFVLVS
ncbi:MAG: hypothetical protein JJE40_00800, partial [Vicinamibacteria bacterium]|nr:hypothetical protein [Vicinamibacteria bacterium]